MKCYVLGAVTGSSEDSEKIFGTYKKALKDRISVIGTPIETAKFKGSAEERFKRAEKSIKEADVIIADVSQASTGAGIELGLAHILGKQIICFAKAGSKVSGLVLGMVGSENIIYYSSVKDLTNLLNLWAFEQLEV